MLSIGELAAAIAARNTDARAPLSRPAWHMLTKVRWSSRVA